MSQPKKTVDASKHREHRERAETLLAKDERSAAADALEQAIACDPFDDDSALLAAMIRFEQGELVEAAGLALEAIRRRPFNPGATNLLGVACLDAGFPDLACKVLRRATRMAPGHEGAMNNLRAAQSASQQTGRPAVSPGALRKMPRKQILQRMGGRKPRLSVCLVAGDGDGEGSVDRCLESLREVATEIILIDMSRQGLDSLSGQSGVTSLRGPHDDAAGALNLGLRRASGDWVLVVRAGERLSPEAVRQLRRDLASRSALYCVLESRSPEGEPRIREIRLFRNAPDVRFTGRLLVRVHPSLEKLAEAWGLERRDAATHLTTDATSYRVHSSMTDLDAARQAADRDLREASDETGARLQRAWLDADADQPEEALERLGRDLSSGSLTCDIDAEQIATIEARCLWRLGRHAELWQRLGRFGETYDETRNTLFLRGLAARALGDPATAAHLLQRCLIDPPPASFMPPLPEIRGAGLPNMLGAALLDLEQLNDADAAFEESLRREPGNLEARIGLLGLRLARGQVQAMLEELDSLIDDHGSDSRVWSLGGHLLARVPQLAQTAELWLEEACRRFPDEPGLGRQLGEARLRCGHPRRALQAWDGLSPQTPAEQAGQFAACLGGGMELPEVPDVLQADVEQGVLLWLQAWMECAAFETLDRALVDMHRAGDRLPGLPDQAADWLRQIGQVDAAARIHEA